MSIGALLWAFYSLTPGLLPEPLWIQPDRVFPYFIGHQLPAGVSGLILAALMAATMSTLSSDLNSLAAILYDDYYNKLKKSRTDVQRLFFSRMSVLITGLLAIVLAMWMTQIKSMADAAFNFVSLVAGGVLGMYLLGIFSKRCSKNGLYAGILVGITFILWAYFTGSDQNLYIRWLPKFPLHTLWIGLLGNLVVFAAGYLVSLLVSPGYKAEDSLTVYQSKGKLTVQKKGY
jgi:SSS family solute:Na+ symporter